MTVPRVGLVGVTGYGRTHLLHAAELHREQVLDLVGYADVRPEAAAAVASVCDHDVPGFGSFAELLSWQKLDVAVIATPIHLHAEMIEQAIGHGLGVLVEKPPVVTINDMDRLLALQNAREHAGGPLPIQVGFQTVCSPAVEAASRLTRLGVLGDVKHIALLGRWQRSDAYYARTGWAGRLVHQGRYVLDGTLTNPFAHGLMNALVIAGDDPKEPATPETVQAELYRCRDSIAGDDTACVRIETTNRRTILAAVTLCAEKATDPRIIVVGSRGIATVWYTTGKLALDPDVLADQVPAELRSQLQSLRPPDDPIQRDTPSEPVKRPELLRNLLDVVRTSHGDLLCPLRMCRSFVLSLNGLYESAGRPRPVSHRALTTRSQEGTDWVTLNGVDALIEHCGRHGVLFSEAGASWAAPTRVFSVAGYHDFDLG
ncbi:MAG TPA: Gfo/Idh/MocA family oxidoreductase [Actinopolymorphaceae bacterium]|jgi:predicted dehydrogenase